MPKQRNTWAQHSVPAFYAGPSMLFQMLHPVQERHMRLAHHQMVPNDNQIPHSHCRHISQTNCRGHAHSTPIFRCQSPRLHPWSHIRLTNHQHLHPDHANPSLSYHTSTTLSNNHTKPCLRSEGEINTTAPTSNRTEGGPSFTRHASTRTAGGDTTRISRTHRT